MGFSPFGGFENSIFSIVPVFIGIIFVIMLSIIIVRSIRGIRQ